VLAPASCRDDLKIFASCRKLISVLAATQKAAGAANLARHGSVREQSHTLLPGFSGPAASAARRVKRQACRARHNQPL